MSIRIARPKGALRTALRLPIHLYHAGLGGLLDHRFLMLTHLGRKSGRLYETILEVIYYDKPTGTSYVVSGWEETTDWYRNIKAHPAVKVQVGRESYTPVQHFLTSEEVRRVWSQLRRKHPLEEQMALRAYSQPGKRYATTRERRAEVLAHLCMVGFRPGEDTKERTEG